MIEYAINQHLTGSYEWLNNRPVFVNMSGGKDSTAVALFLREAGIKFTPIFADTGWEHTDTYRYISEVLEPIFGKFIRVRNDKYFKQDDEWLGGMEQAIRKQGIFPSGVARWCTRELKIIPLQNFYCDLFTHLKKKPVTCIGIRADESHKRSKLAETDEKDESTIYRPILSWSTEDVINIHTKYNLKPNPLYLRGMLRVGCFPCIHTTKPQLRVLTKLYPERFDRINILENRVNDMREERGRKRDATFFYSRRADRRPMPVDEIVEWCKTDRKGRLYEDEDRLENNGCLSWGLCEPLIKSGDQLELFKIGEPNDRNTKS
tara:strand:+ start:114 stop:1070 length:957 start_codon:yes stop_codon:yes gene_type:complete